MLIMISVLADKLAATEVAIYIQYWYSESINECYNSGNVYCTYVPLYDCIYTSPSLHSRNLGSTERAVDCIGIHCICHVLPLLSLLPPVAPIPPHAILSHWLTMISIKNTECSYVRTRYSSGLYLLHVYSHKLIDIDGHCIEHTSIGYRAYKSEIY